MEEKNKTLSQESIEVIDKVKRAMAQENMKLEKDDVDALAKCELGESTYKKERQKVLEFYEGKKRRNA